MDDYYKILQIDRNACNEIISAAYKTLSKKIHPDHRHDRLPEATHAMRKLNEAYAVLKDPVQRAAYNKKLRFMYAKPFAVHRTPQRNRQPDPLFNTYKKALLRFDEGFEYFRLCTHNTGTTAGTSDELKKRYIKLAHTHLHTAYDLFDDIVYSHPGSAYEDDARSKLSRVEKLLDILTALPITP